MISLNLFMPLERLKGGNERFSISNHQLVNSEVIEHLFNCSPQNLFALEILKLKIDYESRAREQAKVILCDFPP